MSLECPVASARDLDFVAAARTAVPALIAEVRRLRAGIRQEIDRYRT